jgi:cbb3-type cytochrome oxidase cytochrome c subunit
LIVASIGGFVQIVPNLFDESLHKGTENVKPYTVKPALNDTCI